MAKITTEFFNVLDPSMITASMGTNTATVNLGDYILEKLSIRNQSTGAIDGTDLKSGSTYNLVGGAADMANVRNDSSAWTKAYFNADAQVSLNRVGTTVRTVPVKYDSSILMNDVLGKGNVDSPSLSYLSNSFILNYYWPEMIWIGADAAPYKAKTTPKIVFGNQTAQFNSNLPNINQREISLNFLGVSKTINDNGNALYIAIPLQNQADGLTCSIRWKNNYNNYCKPYFTGNTQAYAFSNYYILPETYRLLPQYYRNTASADTEGYKAGIFPVSSTFNATTGWKPTSAPESVSTSNSTMPLKTLFDNFFVNGMSTTGQLDQFVKTHDVSFFNKNYAVFKYPLGMKSFPINYFDGTRYYFWPQYIYWDNDTSILINYADASTSTVSTTTPPYILANKVTTTSAPQWFYPSSGVNGTKYVNITNENNDIYYLFWQNINNIDGNGGGHLRIQHTYNYLKNKFTDGSVQIDEELYITQMKDSIHFYRSVPMSESTSIPDETVSGELSYTSIPDASLWRYFSDGSVYKLYKTVDDFIMSYYSMGYKIKDDFLKTNNYKFSVNYNDSFVADNTYVADSSEMSKNHLSFSHPTMIFGVVASTSATLDGNALGNIIKNYIVYKDSMDIGTGIVTGIYMIDSSTFGSTVPMSLNLTGRGPSIIKNWGKAQNKIDGVNFYYGADSNFVYNDAAVALKKVSVPFLYVFGLMNQDIYNVYLYKNDFHYSNMCINACLNSQRDTIQFNLLYGGLYQVYKDANGAISTYINNYGSQQSARYYLSQSDSSVAYQVYYTKPFRSFDEMQLTGNTQQWYLQLDYNNDKTTINKLHIEGAFIDSSYTPHS